MFVTHAGKHKKGHCFSYVERKSALIKNLYVLPFRAKFSTFNFLCLIFII